MVLVDYSSDSSDCGRSSQPKKPKLSHAPITGRNTIHRNSSSSSANLQKSEQLPPLPSAFHDLYASTVRVSASDDPALHQGRKRVNPHKVGNWPSHLYVEWHPTDRERNILSELLTQLQSRLSSSSSSSSPNSSSPGIDKSPITITSFLTSDLGAPQPLHISLSRPIVLSTAQKDPFLAQLESSIASSGVAPFDLVPLGVEWHRTEESARSFLVLRVGSAGAGTACCPDSSSSASSLRSWSGSKGASEDEKGEKEKENENDKKQTKPSPAAAAAATAGTITNPRLTMLLRRSNALVTSFGQPALYAFASTSTSTPISTSSPNRHKSLPTPHHKPTPTSPNPNPNPNPDTNKNTEIDKAFHISIAWSFSPPDSSLRHLTEEVYNSAVTTTNPSTNPFSAPTTKTPFKEAIPSIRVPVHGIKAKIGNVVTHIPLPDLRIRSRALSHGVGGIPVSAMTTEDKDKRGGGVFEGGAKGGGLFGLI